MTKGNGKIGPVCGGAQLTEIDFRAIGLLLQCAKLDSL